MTIVLVVLALLVCSIVGGWLLAMLDPPPPRPARLVSRMWAAKSVWRERK